MCIRDRDLANKTSNSKAQVLADALNAAIGVFLDENKSPSRKVNELDNRGSHYYLALYWAEALAAQSADADLQAEFSPIAQSLRENEEKIVNELNDAQGSQVDLGGYYLLDEEKAVAAMRPSETLTSILS